MTDHAVLVLIVEDDRDLAFTLQQILELCGYQTMYAANGVEALDAVSACMPSVILLDMRMPIMDGWEFANEFFRQYGRAVPIIVMTAAENARERASEIGAAEFLSKPFEVSHLIAAIGRLTGASPAVARHVR